MGSSTDVTVAARYNQSANNVVVSGRVTNQGTAAGNIIVSVTGDWGASGNAVSSTNGGGYGVSLAAPTNVVGRTVTSIATGGAPPKTAVVT